MSGNKRISVLLPPDVFRRFNAYCADQGYKKSPLIARLIREHMDEESVSAHGERDTSRGDDGTRKRGRP